MRLVLAVLLTLAAPLAAAQGRWLDTFAVPGVFEGASQAAVRAVVPDGAGALVGGTFRVVDDVAANGVARWTGSAWETFGGGLRLTPDFDGVQRTGTAFAVVRDRQGAVWVAGRFDAVVQPDGTVLGAAGLARWTGAAWEVPGRLVAVGAQATGHALAVAGGSVYVAGEFTDLVRPDGLALGGSGVVRWTNGVWESLGQRERTLALAVRPDGSVLAPATVATEDGNGALAVVRWDGRAWLPVTGILDGPFSLILSLLVDGDGLVLGGQFPGGRASGGERVASRNVIRWDGRAWQPLGAGVLGSEVLALTRDALGSLLVGGRLDEALAADGTRLRSPGLVRWTGAAWERRSISEFGIVASLARAGVETLVGGSFLAVSGSGNATVRAGGIAALPDGGGLRPLSVRTGRDGTFITDGNGRLNHLAPNGCGGIHVFSDRRVGPLPSGVVRTWGGQAWQPVPTGLRDAALLPAFPGGSSQAYFVSDLAAVPGSCDAFVLAGQFGGVGGAGMAVASPNVVRWTGEAWQGLGRGTDGQVRTVAIGPDGTVTVGGAFTTVYQADGTAVAARGVARWTDASGWAPLGDGVRDTAPRAFDGGVRTLLAEAGGAVVVAGRFESVVEADGTVRAARNVARWTGAAWETFGGPVTTIPGFPPQVTALARWRGDLVVGGDFERVAGPDGVAVDTRSVAVWNGAAWRALPGLGLRVSDLAVGGDDLFVPDGLAGADRRPLGAARWTGTAWEALDPVQPTGGALLARAGRRLYLSGFFETAAGVGSPGLAVFDLDARVSAETPKPSLSESRISVAPNPSRGAAQVTFRLDAPGPARLVLVDALGRAVAVVADGARAAGEHTVRIDTSRLPAGVYAARLDAEGMVRTQRFTVVR